MMKESFCYTAELRTGSEIHRNEKRQCNFHGIKEQRQKRQIISMALVVKHELKTGAKKENCLLCGIPEQFAKDCMNEEGDVVMQQICRERSPRQGMH